MSMSNSEARKREAELTAPAADVAGDVAIGLLSEGEKAFFRQNRVSVLAMEKWLAARDATVARAASEKALLDAADDLLRTDGIDTEVALTGVDYVADWLRDRASDGRGQL